MPSAKPKPCHSKNGFYTGVQNASIHCTITKTLFIHSEFRFKFKDNEILLTEISTEKITVKTQNRQVQTLLGFDEAIIPLLGCKDARHFVEVFKSKELKWWLNLKLCDERSDIPRLLERFMVQHWWFITVSDKPRTTSKVSWKLRIMKFKSLLGQLETRFNYSETASGLHQQRHARS